MLHTYKAILRGNRLEWRDVPPETLTPEHAIPVHITILDEEAPMVNSAKAGPQMAALLEQLSSINAFAAINDPQAWEREVREDRQLLDRES